MSVNNCRLKAIAKVTEMFCLSPIRARNNNQAKKQRTYTKNEAKKNKVAIEKSPILR